VSDLSTVPPNGIWQVRWTAKDTNGTQREFYVEGNTTANPATLSGDYGWHDPGSNFDLGQCVAPCTTVTAAADQAHNRIVLHFKTGQTLGYNDVQNAHVFDAKFPAGTTLGGLNGKTQLLVGGVVGGELVTVDTTTAVSYTVLGNLFCAPDTNPPVAVLKVTPASGAAPLAVTLDGSQSSDPDGVDTLASYTFDFGDGSPTVTTNAPTSSTPHTYKNGGTFQATLKVTDSRGHVSTNPAQQEVVVGGPGLSLNFFTVTPCRVLDTRVQGQGPALSSGTVREVQIANRCGIPVSAVAVSVNLTVVGPTGGGSLNVYPNPTDTPPVTSVVSFNAGNTRANNAVATLNTLSNDGTVQALATMQNGGTVDLVVDVNGYFAP
jgi:hypothetical protein